jgi:hypothetical protein
LGRFGLLHFASDELSTERIITPFWEIVADPKWATVDEEMKEALNHLDHGQRDASAHAFMALESTIKIISNEKGWTRGNETGAARFAPRSIGRRLFESLRWVAGVLCAAANFGTPAGVALPKS